MSLSADELQAVAALWRRERRTFTSKFGGVSMLPTVRPGTPVEVRCGVPVRVGDVVLFVSAGQVVLHRVLSIRDDAALTRGDANVLPDPPVRCEDIVGVATAAQYGESAWQGTLRSSVDMLFSVSPRLAAAAVRMMWRSHSVFGSLPAWFRAYGIAGIVARVWSRTGGRLADVDVLYTLRLAAPFSQIDDGRFERIRARYGSKRFGEACALLRVDCESRRNQEAFIFVEPSDQSLAGCSFNDLVTGEIAHQRGNVVAMRHRGAGVAPALLQWQAVMLAAEGVREVEYHVNVTNLASRRAFAKIGARRVDRWVSVSILRRFRFSWRRPSRSHAPS